jgi:hypothetical protein
VATKITIKRNVVRIERTTKPRIINRIRRGDQGIPGEGDKNYIHDQMTASNIWTIEHNLGKHPSCVIVDSSGAIVEGAIQHIDANQIVVEFTSPFAGKAYLN